MTKPARDPPAYRTQGAARFASAPKVTRNAENQAQRGEHVNSQARPRLAQNPNNTVARPPTRPSPVLPLTPAER